MSLPALHAIKAAGCPLILVGRPWARDLLAGLDPVRFVSVQGNLRGDLARLRAALRPADSPTTSSGRLRGICFPDSLSSALLFRLAGVSAGGYRDEGRSLLLSWPIAKPKPRPHVVQSYYHLAYKVMQRWDLAERMADQPGPTLDLPLNRGHLQAARNVIERAVVPQPFVLLSPTAIGLHRGKIKTWDHYEYLAQALLRAGWHVVVCPPPGEVDAARAAAPSAQILPSLPLGGYAALTRQAALVVCNDSGTSHIAAAAGSRQLTLFGVTSPARTGPWSPHATTLGCEGSWPSREEVVTTALALLADTPRR